MAQLSELFHPRPQLAVIAGAGISIDAPANLLPGWPFIKETVRRAVPPDIRVEDILALVDPPKPGTTEFVRPGEFVRFEVLMSELMQSGLDPNLHVLDCLAKSDRPNRNHYVLADMIRAGCIVITTNFDTLIETAYRQTSAPDESPLRVVCFDEDFPESGPVESAPLTLWKIHGSLDLSRPETRRSIQATMVSMLAPRMTRRKAAFLRRTLEQYDLLTLGYSGIDDLDLIPVVAETTSEKRLFWLTHDSGAEMPTVRDGQAIVDACKTTWPDDIVGWQRMLYTPNDEGDGVRRLNQAFEIRAKTADVMTMLEELYGGSRPIPALDDFRFGIKYPAVVQEFFDSWSIAFPSRPTARYEFVEQLLLTRSCRKPYQRLLKRVQARLRKLRKSSDATAHDKLEQMIDQYNENTHDKRTLEKLRSELATLRSSLTANEEQRWLRLEACVTWSLDGETPGMRAFELAAGRARERGDSIDELSTLKTWRSFAGYSQWSELFPEYVHTVVRERYGDGAIEELRLEARSLTGEMFPDEQNRRLLELADETGRHPLLWEQQLTALRDVIDTDEIAMLATYYRLKRIQRFAIDMGDVTGELQSTYVLGRLFIADDNYRDAFLYLTRAIELGRIVPRSALISHSEELFEQCCAFLKRNYVKEMRRHTQLSMWGREVGL